MPEMSTGQAIKKALSLCLDNYEEAFLAGEDIGIYGGAFGVTDGLLEQYGENRIKDTPISEDVIAGLGVGAAITGMRPIVEMQFSDFIVNAMDPIVNQAAKLHFMYGGSVDVPLIVRGASGGGTGAAAQALEADPDVRIVAMADAFRDRADECLSSLSEKYPDSERININDEVIFIGFDGYK